MNIKIKMIIQRKKLITNQGKLSSKIGKTHLKSKGGGQYKSHISWKFLFLIKKGNNNNNNNNNKNAKNIFHSNICNEIIVLYTLKTDNKRNE